MVCVVLIEPNSKVGLRTQVLFDFALKPFERARTRLG